MAAARAWVLLGWVASSVASGQEDLLSKYKPSLLEPEFSDTKKRIAATLGGVEGFLWGTATAAYQVEGAYNTGGKQLSIWDDFSHTPGKTYQGETGDVADDFYHLYEGDLGRVKELGFNAFRYSISWPRVFPKGADGVHRINPEGIQFYKNVTASLLSRGVTPIVTLYHWDLPNDLDWLNASVVEAYLEYVDIVFSNFPEIKHWATFNEPWTFCSNGYASGGMAPGVKSQYKKFECGHHVLLAHARAVALYKAKYFEANGGTIGIVLNYDWTWPLNASNPADLAAVQCSIDFQMGWFADPIYLTGDYPPCMRERLGEHLPRFTPEQSALIKGSFIGSYLMNTYSGRYTTFDDTQLEGHSPTFKNQEGWFIGPAADSPWLRVVPSAIKKQLEYINARYKPSGIIVTENGCDVPGENSLPLDKALQDDFRINFYESYLAAAAAAVRESNVPLKGYIAWSFEDNYEWSDGYNFRFGLTYVNYTTQERFPKASAVWFKTLIDLASKKPEAAAGQASGLAPPATTWV